MFFNHPYSINYDYTKQLNDFKYVGEYCINRLVYGVPQTSNSQILIKYNSLHINGVYKGNGNLWIKTFLRGNQINTQGKQSFDSGIAQVDKENKFFLTKQGCEGSDSVENPQIYAIISGSSDFEKESTLELSKRVSEQFYNIDGIYLSKNVFTEKDYLRLQGGSEFKGNLSELNQEDLFNTILVGYN